MKINGYYFSRLAAKEKAVYKTMRSGIESFSGEIQLPAASVRELSKIFDCVLRDNPLIFYVSSFNVTGDSQKCRFFPQYKLASHTAKRHIDEIMRYLKAFDQVRSGTEIEKEIYVHDFCLDRFKYDYSFGEHAYSVLGPVLGGAAVCEGIAKFANLALDYLGVKSLIAYGKGQDPIRGTREAHSWNIVEIAGETFHLDITFDMTIKTCHNRYDYFNLCDAEISKDHFYEKIFPVCKTSGKDFYSTRGMTVNSPKELSAHIETRLKNGEKIIVAKLKNVTDAENILCKVMKIAERQYINTLNRSGSMEVRYNPNQMVFEIEYN